MTSTHDVDAYLHRLHRAARRLPADERDELVIGLGTHAEQIRAQGLDPAQTKVALDRLGDPEAIVAGALQGVQVERFRPNLVIWTLATAWLGVLAALALGPTLNSTALWLFAVAGGISQACWLAVLVLSLVGTMWHRWLDTFSTAGLLLAVTATPGLVLASLGSNQGCDLESVGQACQVSSFGWVARAALAVSLVVLVLSTLHWISLLAQARDWTMNKGALSALGTLGAVTALALAYAGTGSVGPADSITAQLINDTGHPVQVTRCPQQDCSGQPTTTLSVDATFDFPPTDASVPDSVVIEAPGQPALCMLSTSFPSGNDPDRFTGHVDMPITQQADAATCGLDLQTLNR